MCGRKDVTRTLPTTHVTRQVVEVLPGAEGGRRPGRVVATAPGGEREVWEADAVVFATGIGAMQRLVAASPVLADQVGVWRGSVCVCVCVCV